MIKKQELQSMTKQEILKKISELKGKLLALRFELASGKLKESHLIRAIKKDVARLFTTLKQLEKLQTKDQQTKTLSGKTLETKEKKQSIFKRIFTKKKK